MSNERYPTRRADEYYWNLKEESEKAISEKLKSVSRPKKIYQLNNRKQS